ERWEAWAMDNCVAGPPHEVLATQRFAAHASAGKPAPLEQVEAELGRLVKEWGSMTVCIREFWREESVATLCGGWIEVLLEAIEHHELLALQRADGRDVSDWEVSWLGEKWAEKDNGPWSSYRNSSLSEGDESIGLDTTVPSEVHGWTKDGEAWDGGEVNPNMSWGTWSTPADGWGHAKPWSESGTDVDWGSFT
ncbi:hypothetical protein EVG20_g682, partial [Dentipellis fragilis]